MLYFGKTYEVDELCTYVGCKTNRIWIAYAYCRVNPLLTLWLVPEVR